MQVRLVAIVPVLGLLLGGCTSGTQAAPKPLPTLEATVSPTPVALQVPESAKPATTVGAAAFARFFLEVMQQAVTSGDFRRFDNLIDSTCSFCSEVELTTKKEYSAGHRYTGAEYTVLTAEATRDSPTSDALVDVLFDRTPSALLAADGSVLTRYPGQAKGLLQIQARRVAGGWVTKGLRFPDAPK